MVGHTALDHLFRVPFFPPKHRSTYIISHRVYFGGGGANVAAAIARLGGGSTLISAVGPEFPGGEYDRWLESIGVRRELFIVNGKRTPTAYVYTDDRGDQITFFEWGASAFFRNAEAPALDFVHMATADPVFNTKIAEKSRFSSFDPGQDLPWYTKEQLETILGCIGILFANRHEMAQISEILGISREEIFRRVPIVIVTMDAEGSMLYHRGGECRIPAVPVQLVDPTGAGDAFRGGFLLAFRRGYEPLVCSRIGTVVASFVVERVGCQTNLPDWKAMEERYRAFFGPLPEADP